MRVGREEAGDVRSSGMLDLEAISGLPMYLDSEDRLFFGSDVIIEETKERAFVDLEAVAQEPEACRANIGVAYYMYNGVLWRRDAERLRNVPLRYELTLLPAGFIGREFVKTFGHLHNTDTASGIVYAEVCEVLLGTAHFLFQTLDVNGPSASAVFVIEARAGDKVIIPPGFDHLTINPGPGPLLFADVIAPQVTAIYDRFRAAHGAAYLGVPENGEAQFIQNPRYRAVAPLRTRGVKEYPELELVSSVPLYTSLVQSRGQAWTFLNKPAQFCQTFPDLEMVLNP